MEIKNVELNNNGMNITFNTKEKDYMYDSLCYRYIRAREHMAEYEYLRDCQSNKKNATDWTVYRQRANRDIMRFCQILDEAIGEHN